MTLYIRPFLYDVKDTTDEKYLSIHDLNPARGHSFDLVVFERCLPTEGQYDHIIKPIIMDKKGKVELR